MTILAFEFSSHRRSVAVMHGGRLHEAAHLDAGLTPIFAMTLRVLAEAGVGRNEVEAVAVGLGPGSYTGVRLGIAAAQGWVVATGARVAGVSSYDAMAAAALRAGWTTGILVTDAQRRERAVAEFDGSGEGNPRVGPLRLAGEEEVRAMAARGARLLGHGVGAAQGLLEWTPSASEIARLAGERDLWMRPEDLEAVYLREASFVKAPPPRELPGLPG